MTQTHLFKITCQSIKSGLFLSAYASTIVYDPLPKNENGTEKGSLIALHFGGEPSTVQALCTLLMSGMALQADTPGGPLELIPQKAKYQKSLAGSNGYAEVLLSLEKVEKSSGKKRKMSKAEVILSRASRSGGFICILPPETVTGSFNWSTDTRTYRCCRSSRSICWMKPTDAASSYRSQSYQVQRALTPGSWH